MLHEQGPSSRHSHSRHPLLLHRSMPYTAHRKLRIFKTAPRGMMCMLGRLAHLLRALAHLRL